MPNQSKWDNLFLKMAMEVSSMSKDKSTKVGSIIVSPDHTKISFGYNGMVAGIEETDDMWNIRDVKMIEVLHSEENNLLNCPFNVQGCTIYITHQPCTKCIIKLAQAKIKRIVYINKYDRLEHLDVWKKYARLFNEVIQLNITTN